MSKAAILKRSALVLFYFVVLAGLSFGGELYNLDLVYKGVLPYRVSGLKKMITTFKLADSNRDQIFSFDNKSFSIYQFNDTKWESRYQGEIDLDDFNYKKLLSGDIDNDNNDELLLIKNKTIIIYNFADGHFDRAAYELPYYPENALIGDIDNDSLNELVMLCADEPDTIDRFNSYYNLCIYDYYERKPVLTWSDNGDLKLLSSHPVVPPQRLMCIADIDNTGYNKLIIPGMKSDASPTYFLLFSWDNNTLIRSKQFRITELSDTLITSPDKNQRKPDRQSKEELAEFKREPGLRQHVFHDVKPGKFKDETYLLTDILDKRVVPVIIRIIDKELIVTRLPDKILNSSWLKWFNIDGQGIGILHTFYPENSDTAQFEFYR